MITEETFVASFESLEFPADDFNHAAHVHLAWIYLHKNPFPEALILFRDSLKRFATHHGVTAIYHETITVIFVILIHDRIKEGELWMEFRNRNSDLISRGKELIFKLYREGTLENQESKSRFVLPDLCRLALKT